MLMPPLASVLGRKKTNAATTWHKTSSYHTVSNNNHEKHIFPKNGQIVEASPAPQVTEKEKLVQILPALYKPTSRSKRILLCNFYSTRMGKFHRQKGTEEWNPRVCKSHQKGMRISSCAKRVHLLKHFIIETDKEGRFKYKYVRVI